MKTLTSRLTSIFISLFALCAAVSPNTTAASPTVSSLYLQPFYGFSYYDAFDQTLTVRFDGPEVFFDTHAFSFDEIGLNVRASEDFIIGLPFGMLVLDKLAYADELGNMVPCTANRYFSGGRCPNAISAFTMVDLPSEADTTKLLVPMSLIAPEPNIAVMTIFGLFSLLFLSKLKHRVQGWI